MRWTPSLTREGRNIEKKKKKGMPFSAGEGQCNVIRASIIVDTITLEG